MAGPVSGVPIHPFGQRHRAPAMQMGGKAMNRMNLHVTRGRAHKCYQVRWQLKIGHRLDFHKAWFNTLRKAKSHVTALASGPIDLHEVEIHEIAESILSCTFTPATQPGSQAEHQEGNG